MKRALLFALAATLGCTAVPATPSVRFEVPEAAGVWYK